MRLPWFLATLALGCLCGGGVLSSGGALGSATAADGAVASSGGPVSLVPARRIAYAGQALRVEVVNRSEHSISRGICLTLARQTPNGWSTVTGSHGLPFSCPSVAMLQPARSRREESEGLPDDLRPGRYRLSLPYRFASGSRGVGVTFVRIRGAEADLPKPRLPGRRILEIAQQAAAAAGDPHPARIQHSAGTRYECTRIGSGEIVFMRTWSYLVAIRGHFTFPDAPRPRGAAAPSGSVLTVVVDAANGRVTDSGLSNRYPRLSALGAVVTDASR